MLSRRHVFLCTYVISYLCGDSLKQYPLWPHQRCMAWLRIQIDFSLLRRIRMIWLDQECLPQYECEGRESGIQAMDMVYQRAMSTVGIFDLVLLSQSHLDAIASADGKC